MDSGSWTPIGFSTLLELLGHAAASSDAPTQVRALALGAEKTGAGRPLFLVAGQNGTVQQVPGDQVRILEWGTVDLRADGRTSPEARQELVGAGMAGSSSPEYRAGGDRQ
jgi:hypothetical protein